MGGSNNSGFQDQRNRLLALIATGVQKGASSRVHDDSKPGDVLSSYRMAKACYSKPGRA